MYNTGLNDDLHVSQPLQYKGQAGCYTDAFAGLLYCHHRWYDPNIARWLSRDPAGLVGGVNVYEYCGSNPLRFVDPSGLERKKELRILLVLGARHGGLWMAQPTIMGPARGAISDFYGALGYEVKFDYLHNPTKAAFESAMMKHDVMVFYGHGTGGSLSLNSKEQWNSSDADLFAYKRGRRLNACYLFTCEGLGHSTDWGVVSQVTFGFNKTVRVLDMLTTPMQRRVVIGRAPENRTIELKKLSFEVERKKILRRLPFLKF